MRRLLRQWCASAAVVLFVGVAPSACVHTVRIELPASPAVTLDADTSRIAVVTEDRECRDVADALVAELNTVDGIEVDPSADTRIDVLRCGRTLEANVDVRIEDSVDRRRVWVDGRAHVLVAVSGDGEVLAHLVASARHFDSSAWGDIDLLGRRRTMDKVLTGLLAEDLVRQVSPIPRVAERRIYPNAAEGSPRSLTSRAVMAELSGDLLRAHRLAVQAHAERPSTRTAAYVAELEQRIHTSYSGPVYDRLSPR